MPEPIERTRSYCFSLFLISLLIFLCYSNTLFSSWHFDDSPNIELNSPLHIDNLMPETLWQTFKAKPFETGTFFRPIANLSFALNWYIGQNHPVGYHIVNILIHIISALFLFRTTLLLFKSSKLKYWSPEDSVFIALFSTILWALNPIQTQAVTYIVQRMASMAAMFFICSIYNYVCARQAKETKQILIHSIICILYFFLALGCKENSITLIPSLLLLEIIFLRQKNSKTSNYFVYGLVVANVFFVLAAIYYAFDHNYFRFFFDPVGSRPFSLYERLLTQPSILIFYLSLLLYANPARLSIDHSFTLSTSLFHPWTTLPAILLIITLLSFAILRYKKNPLFSFAILFFFINHLIESTVIPLELIFEHRNYLPSFFLFLPIAAIVRYILNIYCERNRLVYSFTIATIPFLLLIVGLGTYSRNTVWASDESLWTDALSKAPDNARPFAKLGEIYGWQKEKNIKNMQISVALLQKALDRESPRTSFQPAIIDNIGKVYANYGMLDEAIDFYNRSLKLNPDFINTRFDLANALTLQGKFSDALDEINIVIAKNDLQSRFFGLKTLLLLWLNRPEEAVKNSSETIKRTNFNKERYFYINGVALSKAGYPNQGLWFLRKAFQQHSKDMRIICSLIENRLIARDPKAAKEYTSFLLKNHSIISIKATLKRMKIEYGGPPIDVDSISPIIFTTAIETIALLKDENSVYTK